MKYFIGSSEGATVKDYIEERNSATPTIVVAEISRKNRTLYNSHYNLRAYVYSV
ncbi:MAG: hypothetical protein QXY40_06295 [Candidatus Methanomethylicia archaeon]